MSDGSEVRKPLLSLGRPVLCLSLGELPRVLQMECGQEQCTCSLHPCSTGRTTPPPTPSDGSQATLLPALSLLEVPPSWALRPEEACCPIQAALPPSVEGAWGRHSWQSGCPASQGTSFFLQPRPAGVVELVPCPLHTKSPMLLHHCTQASGDSVDHSELRGCSYVRPDLGPTLCSPRSPSHFPLPPAPSPLAPDLCSNLNVPQQLKLTMSQTELSTDSSKLTPTVP